MPDNFEGSVTPGSVEAEALAELQKEGFEVGEHKNIPTDGSNVPDSNPKEDEPKSEPEEEEETEPEADPSDEDEEADGEDTPESKPERTPTMVPAWKLKVAEDQASKKIAELQALLNTKPGEKADPTEVKEISDEIEVLIKKAEDNGSDGEFLREFAKTLLKTATAKTAPSQEIADTIKEIQEQKQLAAELDVYNQEFDKDVAPLVKEQYGLSDQALLELKSKLQDLAFTETYAKVPLAKIFKAEFDTLGIREPKRSAEGKGIKVRANEVVDLENLSEEEFAKLDEAQVERFMQQKGGGWKTGK